MRRADLLVAITGASGSIYGVRLLEAAAPLVSEVHLIVSRRGAEVLRWEMGGSFDVERPSLSDLTRHNLANVRILHPDDMTAPCASGSGAPRAMVVIPCSMGTAARIAAGLSDDLIARAADVMLKERRKLLLVPRETPLGLLHLRNLTALTEAGATILPASPGFYNHPATVEELVAFVVERVLEHLGLATPVRPWGVAEV